MGQVYFRSTLGVNGPFLVVFGSVVTIFPRIRKIIYIKRLEIIFNVIIYTSKRLSLYCTHCISIKDFFPIKRLEKENFRSRFFNSKKVIFDKKSHWADHVILNIFRLFGNESIVYNPVYFACSVITLLSIGLFFKVF